MSGVTVRICSQSVSVTHFGTECRLNLLEKGLTREPMGIVGSLRGLGPEGPNYKVLGSLGQYIP